MVKSEFFSETGGAVPDYYIPIHVEEGKENGKAVFYVKAYGMSEDAYTRLENLNSSIEKLQTWFRDSLGGTQPENVLDSKWESLNTQLDAREKLLKEEKTSGGEMVSRGVYYLKITPKEGKEKEVGEMVKANHPYGERSDKKFIENIEKRPSKNRDDTNYYRKSTGEDLDRLAKYTGVQGKVSGFKTSETNGFGVQKFESKMQWNKDAKKSRTKDTEGYPIGQRQTLPKNVA
jgi:hypothetical protein